MLITESIRRAREKGFSDEEILKEIIRQNPEKKGSFDRSLAEGLSPKDILEGVISRNAPKARLSEEEIRIEEARKRIEFLKKRAEEKEKRAEERKTAMAAEAGKQEVRETPETPEAPEKPKEPAERFERFAGVQPQPRQEKPATPVRKRFIMPPMGRDVSFKIPSSPPPAPSSLKLPRDMGQLPRKPSFQEKIWVRIVFFAFIIVVLAGIATFWWWYAAVRPTGPAAGCVKDGDCPSGYICSNSFCVQAPTAVKCVSDADCQENYICGSDGVCAPKPAEPVLAPPLFQVDDTRISSVSSADEVAGLIRQNIQEWLEQGQYRRIAIKNTAENKFLGLKGFVDAMKIRVPEELYQKLEDDFILFVYSQREGGRIGFAARIKSYEGLETLLANREPSMENDFDPLFLLMGKTGAGVVRYFRNASGIPGYVGPNFRFQTLTRQDVGICYLISDYYFVFTSSFEGMKGVIAKIGVSGEAAALNRDLKPGDKNDDVKLLQTWLKQDPTVYPQGIVSGLFANLTKQAVIRFQEKYAAEILAPQGYTKGTGIVDEYTRIKLNELYGNTGIIPPTPELITDLKYGDKGDSVKILQSWLAKDREIYPEAIVSGWFGPLTRQAVNRFQEKYKSEILTPSGLDRPTGIVDSLTRRKLNELYGKTK